MKKFIVTVSVASLIAGSLCTAFAENNKNFGPDHKQGNFQQCKMELKNELNLTEEQAAKAKAMREQSREKMKPYFEQIKTERDKLKQMREQNASQEELTKQREKVAALMKQAKEIHKQNLANFESILTPEQKVKFEAHKKQRMEQMKNKHQQRFENRGNQTHSDK
jgi:Spy/CpxP family protein refolding chaperone